jgi:Aspartyl/Asparaginyl beta-hydroxylase
MKNFQFVGTVDPIPLLLALRQHPELWNENDLRTTHPHSPHQAVDDIWVWFNAIEKENTAKAIEDIQTIPYPAWSVLPQVRPLVFDLMRRTEAVQLGRVIVTKLPAGCEIDPHVDQGTPATFYSRYHIALQNLPGSIFKIEDEQLVMGSGEVWAVNNRAEHSVTNNSADDRIVVIVDVRHG